ncbi:MAG TPA: recombination mediator RecR [Deinococcales bacterium]|nr:recombination mediator RecR [Deinococcales bacterium]
MRYPNSLIKLIRELSRLPGVGPKSAQRLAFHLFDAPDEDARALADAILEAKRTLKTCPVCFNVTDSDLCAVCSDPTRDQKRICVVEEPGDVIAIERSGEYNGLYHVLHGVYSPMNGVGPEQLRIAPLVKRSAQSPESEIILATSTTVEGEATAMYVAKQLEATGATVTRIAYGLPVGGALEYADEVTLGRAIAGRQRMQPGG